MMKLFTLFFASLLYANITYSFNQISVNDGNVSNFIYADMDIEGDQIDNDELLASDSDTDFISFMIEAYSDSPANIDINNKTINLVIPLTDVSILVPIFTLSPGATAYINDVEQISGTNTVDFTNPVVYTVKNGENSTDWTVEVITLTPEAEILSFEIPGQTGETMIEPEYTRVTVVVPYNTDLTALVPQFTLTPDAKAYIDDVEQVSGSSVVDFTDPVTYNIVSSDADFFKSWSIAITLDQPPVGALFTRFSIPNQAGTTHIDQDAKTIKINMPYSADVTALKPSFGVSFGTQAYIDSELQENGVSIVDFSQTVTYRLVNENEETFWNVEVTKLDIQSGTEIINFGFSGQTQTGTVNAADHSVTVNLPVGLNLSSLIPVFTLSIGAKAYINDQQIISGGSIVNFSSSRTIRILAENETDYQDWTITITTNQNDQADFVSFSIEIKQNGGDEGEGDDDEDDDGDSEQKDGEETQSTIYYATIFHSNMKMVLHLPQSTDLINLVPSWSVSEGAQVLMDNIPVSSGETSINLSNSVNFTIISQSGKTNIWTLYTYADMVGIDEDNNPITRAFKIYPNPVTTVVNIELAEDMRNGSYQVYDLFGQMVKSATYRGIDIQISMEDLQQGLYFIVITNNRTRVIEKVIVK